MSPPHSPYRSPAQFGILVTKGQAAGLSYANCPSARLEIVPGDLGLCLPPGACVGLASSVGNPICKGVGTGSQERPLGTGGRADGVGVGAERLELLRAQTS